MGRNFVFGCGFKTNERSEYSYIDIGDVSQESFFRKICSRSYLIFRVLTFDLFFSSHQLVKR